MDGSPDESFRTPSSARQDFSVHRGMDSPVVSMKRLMQQLLQEVDGIRTQQETLLTQMVSRSREEEEHRSWVRQRLDSLEHAMREASVAMSAGSASAIPSGIRSLAGAVPLLKSTSFEFARHFGRTSKDPSVGGAFGSASALGTLPDDRDSSRSKSILGGTAEDSSRVRATASGHTRSRTGTGSGRLSRRSLPLVSDSEDALSDEPLSDVDLATRGAHMAAASSRLRRSSQRYSPARPISAVAGPIAASPFASPEAQPFLGVGLTERRAARGTTDADGNIHERQGRRASRGGSQQPPAESMPSLDVNAVSSLAALSPRHRSSVDLDALGGAADKVYDGGRSSNAWRGARSFTVGHGSQRGLSAYGQQHPFLVPPQTSGGLSGPAAVAALFSPQLSRQHSSEHEDLYNPPPLSPPAHAASLPIGLQQPAQGFPSLMRESVRSAGATERQLEKSETMSERNFKGIPPRLVEIYRQRAMLSHWSLQGQDSEGWFSRGGSRRVSVDQVPRPTGLIRQSIGISAATAGDGRNLSVGGGEGGGIGGPGRLSRIALLHGGGGGGSGKTGGSGKRKDAYEEALAFAAGADPNYDHPRMIGDDDEYERPPAIIDWLKLYGIGLIRPEGRTKWDMFILLLLVWVLFASPIIICFGLSGDVFKGDWLGIVELAVDGAFMFDIFLNFRTAYYDSKGQLVSNRGRIARHYLRTWFILDVICVIPYDLITAGTMGFLSMLKLLRVMRVGKVIRMIKMYRLLRVIRLPRILERMENFIDRGVLQVVAFILMVGLLAHLAACIFYYMAYLDGVGPNTWVAAYGVQDADLATRYLTSLYWAFTTVATVGYGDITPKTSKEKVIAIFVMCMGVSLVGYVTSSITNIMAIRNAQQTNIANKKQLVSDVLRGRSVPSELSRRVYNYFDYVSSKMIKREEAELLEELPFKLRSRMLSAFYADMLSRIPAVARLPPHILIEFVSQLKPHYFVEGDIVAMQGDYVDGLYFVSEGLLEVRTYMFPADVEPWRIFEAVHKDELKYMPYTAEGRLKPRCYFGQAGVLHSGVWPATVIARNCCELYALDKEGLMHMLALQPELQDLLGVPRAPVAASAAHAASLAGPGANPLLPPCDRAVLLADFPIMDPAPQRGLMQSMFRSMGHMISGQARHLARASTLSRQSVGQAHSAGGAAGGADAVRPAQGGEAGGAANVFSRFRPFSLSMRSSAQQPETFRLINGDRSDVSGQV